MGHAMNRAWECSSCCVLAICYSATISTLKTLLSCKCAGMLHTAIAFDDSSSDGASFFPAPHCRIFPFHNTLRRRARETRRSVIRSDRQRNSSRRKVGSSHRDLPLRIWQHFHEIVELICCDGFGCLLGGVLNLCDFDSHSREDVKGAVLHTTYWLQDNVLQK